MRYLKKWRVWMGVVISLAFLLYALREQRLPQVWETVQNANYWWLLPGIVVYFLAVLARTWRWHYLLRHLKSISILQLFPVVVIGYMGNNIYPARAGEVIRSYVLKKNEGISISASLATVVVERIFDGVTMLFFVFVTLPFVALADSLRQVVILASLFFFGALIAFFVIASSPQRAESVYGWLIKRMVPETLHERVNGYAERFMIGLHSLRSGRDVIMLFGTSIAIWLTETVKYWFVMHAFPFVQPFYVLMLIAAAVNLATTIPSTPGHVGTFDAPGIKILQNFGVPGEIATGYTLVLHAALWLPVTLLGFFFIWRQRLSWKDLEAKLQERESPPKPEFVENQRVLEPEA